jgi:hypothetical protein
MRASRQLKPVALNEIELELVMGRVLAVAFRCTRLYAQGSSGPQFLGID